MTLEEKLDELRTQWKNTKRLQERKFIEARARLLRYAMEKRDAGQKIPVELL